MNETPSRKSIADQAQTAAEHREQRRINLAIDTLYGERSGDGPLLGALLDDVEDAIVRNTIAVCCRHSIQLPAPIFSAAWTPGCIVCNRCAGALVTERLEAQELTCDGCGRDCEPEIHLVKAYDPVVDLIAAAGLCESCWRAEADGAGQIAAHRAAERVRAEAEAAEHANLEKLFKGQAPRD
jgi:hypothetical protein